MPTPSTAKWPRPKSEDEWEDMVLDAMRLVWQDPNAQRNGRRGQRQHGVDIFGVADGRHVGAQAKNMDKFSETEAKDEIAKAENFQPKLQALHFAVAGPRDAVFQQFIRLLSADRVARGAFPVHVMYFDDICQELSRQSDLVTKYWGSFFLLLSEFLDALPGILSGPVLDFGAATDRIWQLDEFKAFGAYLESASDGKVHASIRVEGTPNLQEPCGTIGRAWHLAIAENHKTHVVTFSRVSVDVDNGAIAFYSVLEDRWIPRDEWMAKNQSFFKGLAK